MTQCHVLASKFVKPLRLNGSSSHRFTLPRGRVSEQRQFFTRKTAGPLDTNFLAAILIGNMKIIRVNHMIKFWYLRTMRGRLTLFV